MSPPRHPKPAVLSARVEATSADSTKWARSAGGVGESLAASSSGTSLTSESCPWPTADRPTGIHPGTTSDHAHKELRNSNLDSLRSARSYEFVLCQRALRGCVWLPAAPPDRRSARPPRGSSQPDGDTPDSPPTGTIPVAIGDTRGGTGGYQGFELGSSRTAWW